MPTTRARPSRRFYVGQAPTVYRSADGRPGPQYWQNRADYVIAAASTRTATSLSGSEVTPTPTTARRRLTSLWLQARSEHLSQGGSGDMSAEPRGGAHRGDGARLWCGGCRARADTRQAADHRYAHADPASPRPWRHAAAGWLRIPYISRCPAHPFGGRTGHIQQRKRAEVFDRAVVPANGGL